MPQAPTPQPEQATIGEVVRYNGKKWGGPLFVLNTSPQDSSQHKRFLPPGTEVEDNSKHRYLISKAGLIIIGDEQAGDQIPWEVFSNQPLTIVKIP